MELTIREAAPLLGRSPRAVRTRIARGELRARRVGRTWLIRSEDLPVTRAQRDSMTRRAEQVRRVADEVVPSRAMVDRDRCHRSVLDMAPFAALHAILTGDSAPLAGTPMAHRLLHRALGDLAAAAHEFAPRGRLVLLRRARRRLSVAAAHLLLADAEHDAPRALAARLEREVVPAVGGLLRWTERRAAQGARA